MTYTYKLARRLAMSRDLSMVSALLLLAACAGDTTGPDSASTQSAADVAVRIVPSTVTIETNQRVRFRGESLRGREMYPSLTWQSTGGTVSADGTFSSSLAGTFKVVGRGRGRNKADTSTVIVVPTQPDVIELRVSPDSVSLLAGEAHTYTVAGVLADGSTTAVGVTWAATGGTIDAGGVFTAGDGAGKYRVVATQSSGTLADTAVVTVTVPVTSPAPTLAAVILSPISTSLSTGKTKQFAAYGRNSVGDSVAVAVTFGATGGSITSSGLYTAGSTAGAYRVVAAASGLSDTAVVNVTPPPTTAVGLPFGPYRLLSSTTETAPFTLSANFNSPSTIVTQIANARSKGVKIMLAMTGGSHSAQNPGCCLSVINGVLQFDHAKWSATLATFNTATIRDAIAKGVADGTILGATVMDEPYVHGGGDGNTWGPVGTMTKLRVDGLCSEVKSLFPTLAVGVEHQHQLFEPTKSYRVCDFIVDQFNAYMGDVATWRNAGLAMGARDGHAILFSMNVLNGGTQDKDGTWDCTGTGGKGLYSPNCRMTAAQVKTFGLALGPSGCGLFMWRYDDAFATNYDNKRSFNDIATAMAAAPGRACRRS